MVKEIRLWFLEHGKSVVLSGGSWREFPNVLWNLKCDFGFYSVVKQTVQSQC